MIEEIYYDKDEYFTNVLNLKNPYNYFNSGFLLFNIKNTLDYDLVNKCMKLMHKIKEPRYVDQCILNVACEDKVYFLDKKWNVENHLKIWRNNLKEELPSDIYNEYEDNLKNAYYLHFSGSLKPWHDSTTYNAHLWWEYARKTPFYEEILSINNKHLLDEQMILKNQIDSLNEQVILLKEQTLNICVDLSKLEYKINNKFYKNFWERIFSVKNDKLNPDKIHKVITILGIKLKIKK